MATATTIARGNVQFADDRGPNSNDESGSLENSFDNKNRGIAWEMKRQAREKRVKELEHSLGEAKTYANSRLDNPYYDNSFRTNVNSNRAADLLNNARSQVGGNQSPGVRNPYDNQYNSNDNIYRRRQEALEAENLGNSMKRTEQRYQEDSPTNNQQPQHVRRISQNESTAYGKTPGVNRSSYRPSEELTKMFNQNGQRKEGLFAQWDDNSRGQKIKQEYNSYVRQELEKERQMNPRLKNKRMNEDSFPSASYSNRQSINPYSQGLSLPNLKIYQRQQPIQQESEPAPPKKSAQQQAYVNDLLDQIKEKEREKQMKKSQKLEEDRKALDDAYNYYPFGRPGGGAPLMNEYSDVNSRRMRDASYNADRYPSYNNIQNSSSQGNLHSPNRVYAQPGYQQSSRLATYGNHVMDNNPGSVDAYNDYSTTNDVIESTERRNPRYVSNPFVSSERQRDPISETHQVPGIGIGYNQRDQQQLQKKQQIANELAQAYQEQMAEKKRRAYEEKLRNDAEERAIEEKVKKELQELARIHQSEKDVSRHEFSRINKSFDQLKEELELDHQGRRVRKKQANVVNKSGVLSKKELDSQERGDSIHQSQVLGAREHPHHAPIIEEEEEYAKSRILNESILDRPVEKIGVTKPSPLTQRLPKPEVQQELTLNFKSVAEERRYRLMKEVSTRTSLLQEQATALKTEALATSMAKQDALRELLKLRDQLKEEKGIEDMRAREMYEYVSKSSVNKLSTNQYNFQNLDSPLDFPMRPREYSKMFNVVDDYDSYPKIRESLDDGVSQFIPIRESNFEMHLKEQPKPKQFKLDLSQKLPKQNTVKIEENVKDVAQDEKDEQQGAHQMNPDPENQVSHRSHQPSDRELDYQQSLVHNETQDQPLSERKTPTQNQVKEAEPIPVQQQQKEETPVPGALGGGLLQNLTQQFMKEHFNYNA